MKKIYALIIGFTLSFALFAGPVDQNRALQIATNFYKQAATNKDVSGVTLTLAYTAMSNIVNDQKNEASSRALLYIFNVSNDGGFVIISADDNASPVLGYSLEGNFNESIAPPPFKDLIKKYNNEVEYIITKNLLADNTIETMWKKLEKGELLNDKKNERAVPALCTTKWGQNPYFNDQCPMDNASHQRTVTGCPATAMAQIMRYWEHPAKGFNSHSYTTTKYGLLSANFAASSYNWASMPDVINSANAEVAKLMYHCGVGVEMAYGIASTGGSASYVIISGAPTPKQSCEYAFKNYFGYDANTIHGLNRSSYSDATWISTLIAELDAGRPMQYAGFSSNSGHTFVCDGYDIWDNFHMNWGWSGSHDGFFDLDALNPGTGGTGSGAGTYNLSQQAIIGITPATSSTTVINAYSAATVTPSTINNGQAFSVNVDVINNGTTAFGGYISAYLYTLQGQYLATIQTLNISPALPSGSHYTGGLTFSCPGFTGLYSGNYIIYFMYCPSGGTSWTTISTGAYSNYALLTVKGLTSSTRLAGDIQMSSDTLQANESFTVSATIENTDVADYIGTVSLDLYSQEDGSLIQTILHPDTVTINANQSQTVVFSSAGLNVEPGSYFFVAMEADTGTAPQIIYEDTFSNPVNFVITEVSMNADNYEPNGDETTAYNIPVNFVNDSSFFSSNVSNLHQGNDHDYYKLQLDTGNSYTITARAHDLLNSGNGNTYTADVLWSYTLDSLWMNVFDAVMSDSIYLNNGGTVIFAVSPYFEGFSGTYEFEVLITRSPVTKIISSKAVSELKVYPNPVKDVLKIDIPEADKCNYKLCNTVGSIVKSGTSTTKSFLIDVSELQSGIYFLSVYNENFCNTIKVSKN